jgi:hypothetical protein
VSQAVGFYPAPAGIGDNGGPSIDDWSTEPQHELITTTKRYPAMVAGFGAGKTQALVKRAVAYKFKYWTCNNAYYLPTYDLIKTIAIPRFLEVLAEYGYYEGKDYKLNKSDSWFEFPNGSKIILRTLDNPHRIIGYEVADSEIDELDTLTADKASAVWKKIIARNRQKKPDRAANTIAVGTTPEGFRFVYEQWHKNPPSAEYHLIRASTYSNAANLPDNYIQDLKDAYPENLIAAYLMGEFVNLTSGSVYPCYDRELNASFEVIGTYKDGDQEKPEPLHIGLDFNVNKMAAVIHVYREGGPHAVAELINLRDTPQVISVIKERWQSQGHPIFVYPDASGNARKTLDASATDLALLQQAGFTVMANASNPYVRDRVLSMNVMFDKRRYRVNAVACPTYAGCLEQQAYDKNGEPDKTGDKDHPNDAGGYFIVNRFPVIKPTVNRVELGGI